MPHSTRLGLAKPNPNPHPNPNQAEAETRHALPQWQEQLQRAEAQLRDLGAQLQEKDAGY